jgi:hypothetical protein
MWLDDEISVRRTHAAEPCEFDTCCTIPGFVQAIYTRKSSDEGLAQDFDSLHAQREACEALAFLRS